MIRLSYTDPHKSDDGATYVEVRGLTDDGKTYMSSYKVTEPQELRLKFAAMRAVEIAVTKHNDALKATVPA